MVRVKCENCKRNFIEFGKWVNPHMIQMICEECNKEKNFSGILVYDQKKM